MLKEFFKIFHIFLKKVKRIRIKSATFWILLFINQWFFLVVFVFYCFVVFSYGFAMFPYNFHMFSYGFPMFPLVFLCIPMVSCCLLLPTTPYYSLLFRFFGENSEPFKRFGTIVGGNESWQPPGPLEIIQKSQILEQKNIERKSSRPLASEHKQKE